MTRGSPLKALKALALTGLKGINTNRRLNAYDTSYIFYKGIITLEGTPAMFSSLSSPIKGSSQTIHANFTPPVSIEPVVATDHPGAP